MTSDDRLAVITGTTSGIGLALTRALLARGWRVLGLARREAPLEQDRYRHRRVDLGDHDALSRALAEDVTPAVAAAGLTRVALVNNAATIGALRWQRLMQPGPLARIFAVNAAAPMALMGCVVAGVPAAVPLRIVNISSGAAHQIYPGVADYGASKAALRLAGRTLAAELAEEGRTPRQAAVLSYEPGLVDTAMQEAARETSPADFPGHEAFQDFAREQRLHPPEAVVGEIIAFLASDPDEQFSEQRFEAS
jgi:benzil reductase ((S)-benzoin forming)